MTAPHQADYERRPRGSGDAEGPEELAGTDSERIVCASFPNPFIQERWLQSQHPILRQVAEGLQSLGCECIPTPDFPGLGWLFKNRAKIDIVHFNWPESFYRPVGDPPKLVWVWRRLLRLCWLVAFVHLARVLRIPIVWTMNDFYPHGQSRTRPFERRCRSFLARRVAALVLCGKSAESDVVEEFGAPRRFVEARLGNYKVFYPDEHTTEEARQQLGIRSDERVLLCFGSMHEDRNGIGVIRAVRALPDPNLRLYVVGSSPAGLRARMEQEAAGDPRIDCHLEDRAEDYKGVSNEQIEVYMKAADWVVVDGKNYLTSAVLVLGLSYGRPVITSDFGCSRSMVGDAGFLYDQHDPNGLKDSIVAALRADQEEYARRAAIRGADFSWEETAEQIMGAYETALTEVGKRPRSVGAVSKRRAAPVAKRL